jgi:thiol:disulfide interchange protein
MIKNFFFLLLVCFCTGQKLFSHHFISDQVVIDVAYTQLPEKEGETYVLFYFQPKNNWHLYWQNPGDSGKAPQVEFYLPEGTSAHFLGFPPPILLKNKSFTSYGYKEPFTLVYQINTKNPINLGDIKFEATWLSCKKTCVPQSYTSTLEDKKSTTIKQAQHEADKLPQNLFSGNISSHANYLTFHIPSDNNITSAYFFPKHPNHIVTDEAQVFSSIDAPQKRHTLKVRTLNKESHIEGILLLQRESGKKYMIVDQEISEPDFFEEETLLSMFLIAFLGGLILNLMPCVFPVLSLKVMNIIGHVKTKRGLIRHGMAYAGGIFLSLMLLFTFVITLKSTGYSVGWGFQLQSPFFIMMLIVLFNVLFLNIFGLFEFQGIQTAAPLDHLDQSRLVSSFLNGMLTTIVSTPCTAPFMGSALAVALSQTYLEGFFIFTGLSLGLAFPFLFISFNPKILSFLPKAGRWMQTLKELLAFPMLGAIIWLLWVLESLKPVLVIPLLIALVSVSFYLWLYGRSQQYGRKLFSSQFIPFFLTASLWLNGENSPYTQYLLASGLIATSALMVYSIINCIRYKTFSYGRTIIFNFIAAFALALSFLPAFKSLEVGENVKAPLPYSQELVNDSLKKGQAVFINYTARWCITCQINKNSVLESLTIQNAFKEFNVVYLEADWTTHSPFITESLRSYKRESIPFSYSYRVMCLLLGTKKTSIR